MSAPSSLYAPYTNVLQSVIPSDSENEDSYQPSGDAAPKAKSTPAKKSKKAVVSDEVVPCVDNLGDRD